MEVILLKHMENLGRRGEVVAVAAGYARNYLLPRKLAMRATTGAKRLVQQEARKFESLDLRVRNDAQELAGRLQDLELSIAAKADDDGKLYGSVAVQDVHAALTGKGIDLTRKQVVLEHPIKAVGEYEVGVKLHLDVKGTIKVKVVKEN
jgi:large subunit ribosomal protein L9